MAFLAAIKQRGAKQDTIESAADAFKAPQPSLAAQIKARGGAAAAAASAAPGSAPTAACAWTSGEKKVRETTAYKPTKSERDALLSAKWTSDEITKTAAAFGLLGPSERGKVGAKELQRFYQSACPAAAAFSDEDCALAFDELRKGFGAKTDGDVLGFARRPSVHLAPSVLSCYVLSRGR